MIDSDLEDLNSFLFCFFFLMWDSMDGSLLLPSDKFNILNLSDARIMTRLYNYQDLSIELTDMQTRHACWCLGCLFRLLYIIIL